MRKKRAPYVSILFLDHAYGTPANAGPIPCEVIGRIIHEDEIHYQVVSWVCNDTLDDPNNEVFTVLKSAVTKVRRLK
jgi:hypothetical protein